MVIDNNTETAIELNIDRSSWHRVKFGDVAVKQNGNVDRETTDLTRYVAGEHMGSEDLHIREWGETSGDYLGPAFHRSFEAGDILYGSRRTYLRKVAVAHFDGITSNTTFVIKANEDTLIRELLPFIMLSEGFAQHSIKNSKGSVNPYINWKDITDYEFLLPPKDQQRQIAELLWAGDEMIEKEQVLKEENERLRNISREKLYTNGIEHDKGNLKAGKCGLIRSDWKELSFLEAIDITSGQVDPTEDEYSGLFQIGPERMEPNTGKILEFKTAKELGISSGNYLFTEKHVLYSKIRPYFKKVANPGFTGLCSADVYPFKPKTEALSKDFLFYYLLTEKFTTALLRFQNRTGMPKVNREELGSMYIPLPTLEEQSEVVGILLEIDKNLEKVIVNIECSKSLQKSLISQFF